MMDANLGAPSSRDDDAQTTASMRTVQAGNLVSNANSLSTPKFQCLVLFQPNQGIPQTLIQPFREEDNVLLTFMDHSAITNRLVDQPVASVACIQYQNSEEDGQQVWNDVHGPNAILSCQVLLDLLQAMQRHGKKLVACSDLYVSRHTAGTLFFQPQSDPKADMEQETACIAFHGFDKIRLIQLPSKETSLFTEHVIRRYWKFGLEKYDRFEKYEGVPEYKLNHDPWHVTFFHEESSNERYLESRRLVLGIFQFMYQHGWKTAMAVDCSVNGGIPWDSPQLGDLDTLLFYRDKNYTTTTPDDTVSSQGITEPQPAFACLCLEKKHKMRLLGDEQHMDGETYQAIATAVGESWKLGITESNVAKHTGGSSSYQVKLNGAPWHHVSTEDSIAAATLICAVIQALLHQGWQWHCALDMTRSVWDKSNFFFRRDVHGSVPKNTISKIGAIQPKGRSKINLVRFPQSYLITLIQQLQSASTQIRLPSSTGTNDSSNASSSFLPDDNTIKDMRIHEDGMSATIEFTNNIHDFGEDTVDAVRNSKLYMGLLTLILQGYPGSKLLGCGDIWTCESEVDLDARDTDVFFIEFPTLSAVVQESMRSIV